jgi:hypothetical protein
MFVSPIPTIFEVRVRERSSVFVTIDRHGVCDIATPSVSVFD